MLTVLHTESSVGWGGQENRTLNEARELKRRGHRALLATRPGAELARRARAEGFEVFEVPMRSNLDLPGVMRLMAIIGRERVDVVNTHSGRDSFLAGLAGRLARRRPRIVRTRHLALPITSRWGYARLPHQVVTVSRQVREDLIAQGVPAGRIVAIPTGIDVGRYASATPVLREELAAGTRLLIGTVAILRKKKGHAYLLEAIPEVLREFPDALFVFAGDGPQRQNLERRIVELGLSDSVRILGLRRDVPNVLASLDLFVLPTLQEALGTSYAEAMATGCATVGCAVGGVPEVVHDGETGLLVPPAESAPLAAAILALLRDPARRAAMGAAGRRLAEREYSLTVMSERMVALYESLLAA
ncbi:MAG TPA: glycosyltransferase family 4 protein [Rhodocyclaceae bacterium]